MQIFLQKQTNKQTKNTWLKKCTGFSDFLVGCVRANKHFSFIGPYRTGDPELDAVQWRCSR